MKIAICAPGDLPIPAINGGAIETLTTYLIDENEKYHKHNITVFTSFYPEVNNINKRYNWTKINAIIEPPFLSKLYLQFRRLLRKITFNHSIVNTYFIYKVNRILEKEHFDRIIIEGNYLQFLQLGKSIQSKTILHIHTDILNVDSLRANYIVNSCKSIIVISEYIKERVLQIDSTCKDKIHVLRNVIDTTQFGKESYVNFRRTFRHKNNISDNDFVIIFCGRLDPGKGIKELLEAVVKLQSVKLVVVGSSWFSNSNKSSFVCQLEEIAKFAKGRVIFTGYVSHEKIGSYYSVADLGVFPSTCDEAAGLVVIEAMASGLPVVTTNKGGIPEYADKDACILVNPDDGLVEQLIDTITFLIKNPDILAQMGLKGREISRIYSINGYFDNFCKLIK